MADKPGFFQKGGPSGNPNGRPKGVKNKTTAMAKENIIAVFNRLGGTAEMAKWAKDNLTEFYKLYARLIPTETTLTVKRHISEIDDADLEDIARSGSGGAAEEESGEANGSGLH